MALIFLLRFRKKRKTQTKQFSVLRNPSIKKPLSSFQVNKELSLNKAKAFAKKPQGRLCSVYNFVVTTTPIDFFFIFLNLLFSNEKEIFVAFSVSACKTLLDPWWNNVWHTCIHGAYAQVCIKCYTSLFLFPPSSWWLAKHDYSIWSWNQTQNNLSDLQRVLVTLKSYVSFRRSLNEALSPIAAEGTWTSWCLGRRGVHSLSCCGLCSVWMLELHQKRLPLSTSNTQ